MKQSMELLNNYFVTVVQPEQMTEKVKKCLELEFERALVEKTVIYSHNSEQLYCSIPLFKERSEEMNKFYEDFGSIDALHQEEIHNWLNGLGWKLNFSEDKEELFDGKTVVTIERIELVAETTI